MRHLTQFSVAIMMTLTTSLIAQIDQGTIGIGPSLSFSSVTTEFDGFFGEMTQSNFDIALTGAYFVVDNLGVGLGITFGFNKTEFDSDEVKGNLFAIGPDVTYYIELGNDFYLPISGGLAFGSNTTDDDFEEITLNGIVFGFGAGLSYIVDDAVGVNFGMGYAIGSLKHDDSELEVDRNAFSGNVGFSLFF